MVVRVVILCLLAFPAQALQCLPWSIMVEQLKAKYGERHFATIGIGPAGVYRLEEFVSPDWSYTIVRRYSKLACIVEGGGDWRITEPAFRNRYTERSS